MCLKIYPVKFILAPGLAWKAALKQNRSKVRIIK